MSKVKEDSRSRRHFFKDTMPQIILLAKASFLPKLLAKATQSKPSAPFVTPALVPHLRFNAE
jgi:hypothetical protein